MAFRKNVGGTPQVYKQANSGYVPFSHQAGMTSKKIKAWGGGGSPVWHCFYTHFAGNTPVKLFIWRFIRRDVMTSRCAKLAVCLTYKAGAAVICSTNFMQTTLIERNDKKKFGKDNTIWEKDIEKTLFSFYEWYRFLNKLCYCCETLPISEEIGAEGEKLEAEWPSVPDCWGRAPVLLGVFHPLLLISISFISAEAVAAE